MTEKPETIINCRAGIRTSKLGEVFCASCTLGIFGKTVSLTVAGAQPGSPYCEETSCDNNSTLTTTPASK